MSSIVCPALQSRLEPRFVEQRTHGLKLATPKPHFPRTHDAQSPKSVLRQDESKISGDDSKSHDSNTVKSGNSISWADIHSITDTLQTPKEAKDRCFSSTLSIKSLEMCTERLGCETGTDISDNSLNFSSSSSSSSSSRLKSREQIRHTRAAFPPPLTTITGKNSIVVRPQREDGRLILKAIKISSPSTYLQAERGGGRLRLRFISSYTRSFHVKAAEDEEIGGEENEDYDQGEENKEDEEEEEEEEERRGVYTETNEKSTGGEGEMGMEKFQKPSRCKDGGCGTNGLLIWEPFWVASA